MDGHAGALSSRTGDNTGRRDGGAGADSADAGSSPDGGGGGKASTADAGAASDAGVIVKRALQLTFDDGPDPVTSALDPILTEVATRGVVAAFFVIGDEVRTTHSAITRVRDARHVVGNHSWDHLAKGTGNYTDEEIYDQFDKTHQEVKAAGVAMEHWRAPRGEQTHRIQEILTASAPPRKPLYSKTHCDWHADSRDAVSASSAEDMLRSIERDFGDPRIPPFRIGGVRTWRLLFHVKPSTASALGDVLDELQRRGGRFADFSQD